MRFRLTLTLICCLSASAYAQAPLAVNAHVTTRSASGDLKQTFTGILKEQLEPAWVGYIVPAASGGDGTLRDDGWSERCRLEQTGVPTAGAPGFAGPVRLEPSPAMMVLFRLQNHEVQRIRSYS